MKTLDEVGPYLSPLDIPITDAKRKSVKNLKTLGLHKSRLQFLDNATKIVFGRDPFVRVFSAYIDKLYSPNPTYWKKWGQKALFASNLPVVDCGSNVNFEQFVRLYFYNNSEHLDIHLTPVSDECRLCEMNYNVLGKLETIVPDLVYISNLINVSSKYLHDPKHKYKLREDGIIDTVNSVFSWIDDIKECMSLDQMGKRIWRKFQIRGVIDSNINYPLLPGQIETMSYENFLQICRNAIAISKDKSSLKRQVRIALEEAYISLPKDLIKKMIKIYRVDLEIFGYTQDLDYLTNDAYRSQFNISDVFNWNSPWIL